MNSLIGVNGRAISSEGFFAGEVTKTKIDTRAKDNISNSQQKSIVDRLSCMQRVKYSYRVETVCPEKNSMRRFIE